MTNRRRLSSSSSSSSSSSQKTMGSSSSSKRGTTAARKIEGLVDAKAIQEREKMWARAAKGSGKKSAEDKYGYLFGDGTKRQTTTRRSGGEKDLQHEEKEEENENDEISRPIEGRYTRGVQSAQGEILESDHVRVRRRARAIQGTVGIVAVIEIEK